MQHDCILVICLPIVVHPLNRSQIVQHVTGFNHYLAPPLFGFSLSMSVLMCECPCAAECSSGVLMLGVSQSLHAQRVLYLLQIQNAAAQLPLRSAPLVPLPPPADLQDGPGGTKLIGKQVDYHSFESIL